MNLPIFLSYLLQTYIVTSKPKRISVADGVVHIMFPFILNCVTNVIILCITSITDNGELVYGK